MRSDSNSVIVCSDIIVKITKEVRVIEKSFNDVNALDWEIEDSCLQ